ncbi:S41 family peptidase [Acidocella aromatica]|uniref:Carboxyl-terminal processing protease n=1 Tax=Acidocella aromatica TaxID=1303579 RepID=A0A840VKN0_9PROT|nr:S41 family peptidase [Acidocella aromatica]MBB5372050.1 carboxyl-terminal processing protease [Acidocella aromatica]
MRLRGGLLLSGVFLGGLALGTVAQPLTRAMGQNAPSDSTYQQLSLFGDVLTQVKQNYVMDPPSDKLIYNAINGMLSGLDPHSSYMNAKQYADMQVQTSGQFGGLGLEVTEKDGLIEVIAPIDGTPGARAGIKHNDIILEINGHSTDGLALDDAVAKMRGTPGTQITLTIKRNGVNTPIHVTLTREVVKIEDVKSKLFNTPDGPVGYIRLSSFDENADPHIRNAVNSLRQQAHGSIHGYILDLRDNPGGLLDQAVAVSDDFLNSGEIVSTHGRHSQDDQVWYAQNGDVTNGAPIVILTDAGTASAAEIVTAALQQNRRALVLGTKTFGKGSVQTIMPIDNEGALRLTTALYFTPSGKSIQGYGVTPDVKVSDTNLPDDAFFAQLRETDLLNSFANPTGQAVAPLPAAPPLPAVASQIQAKPPQNWPAFDPTKPDTDFQLQMGIKLLDGMTRAQ